MKIYTGTGDNGTTGLFGGPRVSKADARIEAYGTVDELNAVVGFARALLADDGTAIVDDVLAEIQSRLLILGADLSTPPDAKVDVPRIQACHASDLEEQIDRLEEELPELTQFILPGGSKAAAAVHLARTICRRAERLLVRLEELEGGQTETLVFLNRLSDYLFVASRWINIREGGREETWSGS